MLSSDDVPSPQESLTVSSAITGPALIALLKKTKNLKKLSLFDCEHIGGIHDFDGVDLTYLERFALAGRGLTGPALIALLEKTKHLMRLEINCGDCLKENLSFDGVDLTHLEYLDMSRSTVSVQGVKNLLKKTQRLRTLNLAECKGTDVACFDDLDLGRLDLLSLSDLLSHQSLIALLKKTNQLTILDLSRYSDIVGLSGVELSQLKELTVYSARDIEDFKKMHPSCNVSVLSDQPIIPRTYMLLDSMTEPQFLPLHAKLFKSLSGEPDILPSHYRMNVYDRLDPKDPGFCSSSNPLSSPVNVDSSKAPTHEGVVLLNLNSKSSVGLPSLSPDETLVELEVLQKQTGEVIPAELFYSTGCNFYSVKLPEGQSSGQYLVRFKIHRPKESVCVYNPELQALIAEFRGFTEGRLTSQVSEGLLDRIYAEKKGACRHRALCFKHEVEQNPKKYPYDVRVVDNQRHVFVEVRDKTPNASWTMVDLGGYSWKQPAFDRSAEVLSAHKTTSSPPYQFFMRPAAEEERASSSQQSMVLSK